MRALKFFFLILLLAIIFSCEQKNNVIQGLVTYVDNGSNQEFIADSTDVYLYFSKVDFQNQSNSWEKKVATAANGYYSLFPLKDGPYYVHCKRLDKNGVIVYSGGSNTSVSGNETKILNITIF